ncbi:hypothetical protein Purlil1_12111 [Purpureocillium lilacinum]|uniref:Uncharacterized protein n=1 Tax=Purpureocillium lilacinum TaxID=33203 RepID=A0ABR0BHX2_PURLI|nr:hypothetical protein Purlil1_12111 [Purpureocillium lilacinum]
MDETIQKRAKLARDYLDTEKSQPLKALYFMACAVRDWSRVPEADRKKDGRPSFSEEEWERLVGLLPTELSLHDHAPAEADGKTCGFCTFDAGARQFCVPEAGTGRLGGSYTVSLSGNRWFHAECMAVHLMDVNEQCPHRGVASVV